MGIINDFNQLTNGVEMYEDMRLDVGDLVLRHYTVDDIPDIVEHINDAKVSRFTIHVPFPYGEQDAVDFLEKNQKWLQDGLMLNLAIVRKEDDRMIGGIGLMNLEEKFHHAEIGYWIGRRYWGKGIVPMCVREMVRFGFEKMGL